MFLKSEILIFFLFIITKYNFVSSDEVPAMIWNIKGNSLHVKPVSALERNDKVFADCLNDILHQGSKILVFSVNKLSLEDFSANDKLATSNSTLHSLKLFLDSHPHMLLSSVKDPLNEIHKAHCGVQEIVVDQTVDSTMLQSISLAFDQSCIVILHISDEGIITKNGGNLEEIKKSFLPSLENAKNIVGIFTAMKSSLGLVVNDHHIFRNLLALESANPNFINFDGCIIMYVDNATLKMGKEGNSSTLTIPPTTDGSSCNNASQSFVLQLNFAASGPVTAVTLKFSFSKKAGSWKTKTTVSITGDKAPEGEVTLGGDIGAPLGFSYSCGQAVLEARNVTVPFRITLNGFQVQPFEIKNSVFSDSFDCVPFFTIPIWMGIFVSLLFIVIMNVGIYALFSVHTMDRFDDPKGKTIAVAAAAD